jgi:hypothetical protein
MSKSKNTNPNIYRSKWDMPHSIEKDYKRKSKKQMIEEEYEMYKEDEKEIEEEMKNEQT